MADRKEVYDALNKIREIVDPLFPDSCDIEIEITPRKITMTERSLFQEFSFTAQKPPLGKKEA